MAPLCVALLLPGCSGAATPATQATSGPGSFTGGEWRVTVRNQTDRYVWMTRYWTTKYTSWHIEGSSICISPNGETTQAVTFSTGLFEPQAKIRAEIKPAGSTDCSNGANTADLETSECKFDFGVRDVYRGEVIVYHPGNDWKIHTVCHSGPA